MPCGYIKFVNLEREFGFIAALDDEDVYFHRAVLKDGLEWNEQLWERRVVFEVDRMKNGKERAINVRAAR